MHVYTKLLVSGLSVYLGLLLACVYRDNQFRFSPSHRLRSNKELSDFLRKVPLAGSWRNVECGTSFLGCEGGQANAFFGTLYTLRSYGSAVEGSLVLVVQLLNPRFYDEDYLELVVNLEDEQAGVLRPVMYNLHAIEHSGFYVRNQTAINATAKSIDCFFGRNETNRTAREVLEAEWLLRLEVEAGGEYPLAVALELGATGARDMAGLTVYAGFGLAVFGLNLLASLHILQGMQTSPLFCTSMSLYTVFLVLCQDTLLFVVNIVWGLTNNNSTLILLTILPTLLMCLDCMILLKVWMATELMPPAGQPNRLRASMGRYFFMHAKLYLLEIAYLYLMMRYYLDMGLVVLNGLLLLPQIAHNASRRTPTEFEPRYLFGFASLKYLFFIYFRGLPWSIFPIRYSWLWPYLGLLLLVASIALIRAQFLFGGRFFIPARFRSVQHNYFIRKAGLAKAAKSLELSASEQNSLNSGTTAGEGPDSPDADCCCVCQDALLKTPSDEDASKTAQELLKSEFFRNRLRRHFKAYVMETPCHHRFHCECLLGWMEIKMICPICRTNLPLVE